LGPGYGDFQARAERQQQHIVEISPKRADILDRNLQELAMNTSLDSCFGARNRGQQARGTVAGFCLGCAREEIATADLLAVLCLDRAACAGYRGAHPAGKPAGIYFQKENQRFTPGEFGASVLDYVDIDERLGESNTSSSSIQKQAIACSFSATRNRWYESAVRAPEGSSVVLTLDENVNHRREELATAIEQTRQTGTVLVRILQARSWPWQAGRHSIRTLPAAPRRKRA
jgi:hypothetical protein